MIYICQKVCNEYGSKIQEDTSVLRVRINDNWDLWNHKIIVFQNILAEGAWFFLLIKMFLRLFSVWMGALILFIFLKSTWILF